MIKLKNLVITHFPMVIWSFLLALIFDVANIDDFFPSIQCVHADDAEILSITDNFQDALAKKALQNPLARMQFKSGQKYLFLRYDFDSPAHLDRSLFQHNSFSLNFIPPPSVPVEPVVSRYFFIEFCSFLI